MGPFRTSSSYNIFLVFILVSPFLLDLTLGEGDDLYCWECGGNASPLCEGNHEGKSVICPGPDSEVTHFVLKQRVWDEEDDTDPPPEDDSEYYVCMIMMTESYATNEIQITKGCQLDLNFFYTVFNNRFDHHQLQDHECYVHDDNVYDKQLKYHKVTICLCWTKNDCNKDTINGTGREDIEARARREKSEAPVVTLFPHLILISTLITCHVIKNW